MLQPVNVILRMLILILIGFLIYQAQTKVMLKKGSYIFLILIILFSCEKLEQNDVYINIQNRSNYISKNFNNYKSIYMLANDSISFLIKSQLDITKSIAFEEYQLDSILIFNSEKTRFYTIINRRHEKFKNSPFDGIEDFGGAKINGKWYFFFMGVSSPVRREDWQDSVYAPLTFEELSYVAYESHFKTLVKNINEGKLEKNEEIFKKRLFFDISGIKNITDERRKQFEDSVILAITKEKYKYKLAPKEIADIKQSIAESKLPADKPLVKSYSWWEILQYGEKPFESDAWKNRNKRE